MFLRIQNHSLISSLVRKTIYLNCNFMAIPKVPHFMTLVNSVMNIYHSVKMKKLYTFLNLYYIKWKSF